MQSLGQKPCEGSVFVFRNACGNCIKVLLWDGNGVWLCQRRLHQGHFIWPKSGECSFSITQAQWEWLIARGDWQDLSVLPPPIKRIDIPKANGGTPLLGIPTVADRIVFGQTVVKQVLEPELAFSYRLLYRRK